MPDENFAEIYDRFARPIYKFIFYKTWNRAVAEDLASQTFLKACENFADFSGSSEAQTGAWLYRIARNTVIDHYRTAHPTENVDDAWDLADAKFDTEKDTENSLELDRVKKILATLPRETREILVLRIWENLSHADIADRLGKSEASCKMAFSRGIRALRDELATAAALLTFFNLFS